MTDPRTATSQAAAAPTQPSIRDRIGDLLPAHTYFQRRPAGGAGWTWTTPQGVWGISSPTGDMAAILRLIGGEPTAVITLTGPNGVQVDLPRTDRGFEALEALLIVLGAIEPKPNGQP